MQSRHLLTITFASALALAPFTQMAAQQQEPDKTAAVQEFERREQALESMPIDDQLKVRAAQQKALETKDVKAALEKRDQAIIEFRAALRAAMIAADPAVQPILERLSQGGDPSIKTGN